MKALRAAALATFVAALAGCTTEVPARSPYHEVVAARLILNVRAPSAPGARFAMRAGSPETAASPDFKSHAAMVARGLATRGMTPVDDEAQADLLVFLDYTIADPETEVHRYKSTEFRAKGRVIDESGFDDERGFGRHLGVAVDIDPVDEPQSFAVERRKVRARLEARDAKKPGAPVVWTSTAEASVSFGESYRHRELLIAAAISRAGENAEDEVLFEIDETSPWFKQISGSWIKTRNPAGKGVFRTIGTYRLSGTGGDGTLLRALRREAASRGMREVAAHADCDAEFCYSYDSGRLGLLIQSPGACIPTCATQRTDRGWWFDRTDELAASVFAAIETETEGY